MADKEGAPSKRKRTEEQKKAKWDSDRARAQTNVNLGPAFTKWSELRDLKGFKTDLELALFLIDRYVIFVFI